MCWREEVLFERQETKGPESNSVLLDSQKKSPEVLQHSSICEVLSMRLYPSFYPAGVKVQDTPANHKQREKRRER